MKKLAPTIFLLALAPAVALASPPASPAKSAKSAKAAGPTPVLVELFTSEGCSDCPPADGFLGALATHQPITGAEIIPISEHVTYWNHQGWVDPYSSQQWTLRQEAYARVFKQGQVYTPEMFVDGTKGFVGAEASKAELAIEKAAVRPYTKLSVHPGKLGPGRSLRVEVTVGKLVGDTSGAPVDVWLGVTQSGLRNTVTGGENKGRVLYEPAVLRSLRKIGVLKPGRQSESFQADPVVKFNRRWKLQNLQLVVFLQNEKSLRILGVAAVPALPQSRSAALRSGRSRKAKAS